MPKLVASVAMRTTGLFRTPAGIRGSRAVRIRQAKSAHSIADSATRPRIGAERQG